MKFVSIVAFILKMFGHTECPCKKVKTKAKKATKKVTKKSK